MSKGMIRATSITVIFLLSVSLAWAASIWKVVDKEGNVVYTDQPPEDGSEPMDLPELSVIETDFLDQQAPAEDTEPVDEEDVKALTAGELRKLYRDFRITRPFPEETFWGTSSTVVVTWGSKTPLTPDLNVRLFVDGKARSAPATGGVSLKFERGAHKVVAELLDARNRRITRTEPVTFFVQQYSVNFNRPRSTPNGGSG